MKSYKVFNPDWTCRDFKFEIGKSYHIDNPIMCERGFHSCKKLADCFSYYAFNSNNKVAEVEIFGTILGEDDNKQCSSDITIVKEITWHEVLDLCNTGDWNTGDSNTGNRNTGNRNTGDSNTGDWNTGDSNTGDSNTGNRNTGNRNTGDSNTGDRNTGDSNTGDWNTGDCNTGFFNSITPDDVLVFNKPCKRIDWENVEKPNFIYFNLIEFVYEYKMTEEEKGLHPSYKLIGGYLKSYDYKEAFQKAYNNASNADKELITKLPNFDKDIFFEITGIRI